MVLCSVIFSFVVCIVGGTATDAVHVEGDGGVFIPIPAAYTSTATNPSTLKAAAAPPVRLDLSGSMNIHVLGPSTLVESPSVQKNPPIFDVPWRWCSVFCGARYKRRRLTHVKSTLRWYSPISQQCGIMMPSHCDITREQSVARSKHPSRTRLQWHWKRHKAWWQWQWTSDLATATDGIAVASSPGGSCSTMVSIPLGNQRFRYECQVSNAPTRRPAPPQQLATSWWSPDLNINAQGHLEASNWSTFGDSRRMRLFVALRRQWLASSSDDGGQPVRAVVRFESPYGYRSNLRWTTMIGDCTRPFETFRTSLRHEIVVGAPVVTSQLSSSSSS